MASPLVIAAIQRRSEWSVVTDLEPHFEHSGRSLPTTQGIDTKHSFHQLRETVTVERERAGPTA
jgi:hypothetical protein